MFFQEFYPTPLHVIELMTDGLNLQDKKVLEPSAGRGDIVEYLQRMGADVIACENNPDLSPTLAQKCRVIASDFFTLTSEQVSHLDFIIMNPPFSNADKHILHAYEIAPDGCKIISLCNIETMKNAYTNTRKTLLTVVENYGNWTDIGNPFNESERRTDVNTALLIIDKPAKDGSGQEFSGFFTDDDPTEQQFNGIMPYNVVRDIVNRYVEAVRIFDEQLETAVRLRAITSGFYGANLAFQVTEEGKPKSRNDFKKELQKSGWKFIFEKMNLQKVATRKLREDINKFVEQQVTVPFTMRNIYRMLEIVIGTTESRIGNAINEVFDTFTQYHADNKYNLPGWKTNSHFLLTKRFILPDGCEWKDYNGHCSLYYGRTVDNLNDLEKCLCYITGENWDQLSEDKKLIGYHTKLIPGEWYETHFFKLRGYKKGTLHIEFKDAETWGKFNQRVAKIKGFPLFEAKEQTAYQKKQTGRPTEPSQPTQKAKVLYEFDI